MIASALLNVLQVLVLDASSTEAVACLAAEHFYSDQPEVAIRYYRRLLQVCQPPCRKHRLVYGQYCPTAYQHYCRPHQLVYKSGSGHVT
jgi:hypothetical protein